MKTKDRPLASHASILNSFLDYAEVSADEKEILRRELKNYIENRVLKQKWCHPLITKFHTDFYRALYRLVEKKDPYKELKERSNQKAQQIIEKINLRDIHDIIKLTIIGNKIDFGACINGLYDLEQLDNDVKLISQEKLSIDDTEELIKKIQDARNVFYLFDNNGELIFDKLLLDYIQKYVNNENIFLVAKESPMLNDVIVDDLKNNGFQKYGKITSTGSNCFGIHEEDVSYEFKQLFKKADLIIAKGQAYFEFFSEYNFSNIFNILHVKQEIKGDNIPLLTPGMNIVISSKKYAGNGLDYKWD